MWPHSEWKRWKKNDVKRKSARMTCRTGLIWVLSFRQTLKINETGFLIIPARMLVQAGVVLLICFKSTSEMLKWTVGIERFANMLAKSVDVTFSF